MPEHVEPVSAGVDDSLLMPSISGIRGVSLWVWLDTRAEVNYVVYFLDARSGDPNGQFSNTCAPQPPLSSHSLLSEWLQALWSHVACLATAAGLTRVPRGYDTVQRDRAAVAAAVHRRQRSSAQLGQASDSSAPSECMCKGRTQCTR
jgi:hypothetical protein